MRMSVCVRERMCDWFYSVYIIYKPSNNNIDIEVCMLDSINIRFSCIYLYTKSQRTCT